MICSLGLTIFRVFKWGPICKNVFSNVHTAHHEWLEVKFKLHGAMYVMNLVLLGQSRCVFCVLARNQSPSATWMREIPSQFVLYWMAHKLMLENLWWYFTHLCGWRWLVAYQNAKQTHSQQLKSIAHVNWVIFVWCEYENTFFSEITCDSHNSIVSCGVKWKNWNLSIFIHLVFSVLSFYCTEFVLSVLPFLCLKSTLIIILLKHLRAYDNNSFEWNVQTQPNHIRQWGHRRWRYRQRKKNKGEDKDNGDDCDEFDDLPIEEKDTVESTVDHGLIKNLRINTKNQSKSLHPIWEMFGKLEKNGKTIAKAKDRIFCVHCFEKKKMKR